MTNPEATDQESVSLAVNVKIFTDPQAALAYKPEGDECTMVALVTEDRAQAEAWRRWHPNLQVYYTPPEPKVSQATLDLFGPA